MGYVFHPAYTLYTFKLLISWKSFPLHTGWTFRPPWHRTWSLINGGLAGLLGAAYMLASIFLILVRSFAPAMFIAIAGASMLRNVVAFSVGISSGSFFMFWSVSSAVMGFLVDLVLVIVVFVSDKSDYKIIRETGIS